MSLRDDLQFYAVTDRHWLTTTTLEQEVQNAIAGGVTCVQLREKDTPIDEFYALALKVQAVCKDRVPFIINDNVELALKVGADGVHVGQNDANALEVRKKIGDKILGVSAQTVEQALLAEKQGADYLGVGAVFSTTSKDDADSVSIEELTKICNAVKIPVVAIGGINLDNLSLLKDTGIAGVSIISAIFANDNVKDACVKLKEKIITCKFGETK